MQGVYAGFLGAAAAGLGVAVTMQAMSVVAEEAVEIKHGLKAIEIMGAFPMITSAIGAAAIGVGRAVEGTEEWVSSRIREVIILVTWMGVCVPWSTVFALIAADRSIAKEVWGAEIIAVLFGMGSIITAAVKAIREGVVLENGGHLASMIIGVALASTCYRVVKDGIVKEDVEKGVTPFLLYASLVAAMVLVIGCVESYENRKLAVAFTVVLAAMGIIEQIPTGVVSLGVKMGAHVITAGAGMGAVGVGAERILNWREVDLFARKNIGLGMQIGGSAVAALGMGSDLTPLSAIAMVALVGGCAAAAASLIR